jgi:NMD protein affecting ribosome stability and mRNA decay
MLRSGTRITLKEGMTTKTPKTPGHRHSAVVTHLLRQRSGVPFEVEQKVCKSCQRVLDERLLRRAAA